MSRSDRCPCCSGKTYGSCCQKYHDGALPETALELMRSRYSAYALAFPAYIIQTTHTNSSYYVPDKKEWLHNIQTFSKQVTFEKLDILETQLSEPESFVTFVAHLRKNSLDLTFTEKSRFLKEGHSWLYFDGKIVKGHLTADQLKKL